MAPIARPDRAGETVGRGLPERPALRVPLSYRLPNQRERHGPLFPWMQSNLALDTWTLWWYLVR